MPDFHILLSLVSILIAWKWGDWRNWELYHPTILYLILGDLIYLLLSSDKPLWQYESTVLNVDFVELLIAFVVFPCTCLVFLPFYSKFCKSKNKSIVYILFWIFIYISVEWLSFRLGFFSYHNGWNLYWSFGFDCIMFPLLILHHKRPFWALPPTIILAFAMIYLFDLPFYVVK